MTSTKSAPILLRILFHYIEPSITFAGVALGLFNPRYFFTQLYPIFDDLGEPSKQLDFILRLLAAAYFPLVILNLQLARQPPAVSRRLMFGLLCGDFVHLGAYSVPYAQWWLSGDATVESLQRYLWTSGAVMNLHVTVLLVIGRLAWFATVREDDIPPGSDKTKKSN
ncbi:hypothetical protein BJ742DRAFT_841515 [Cladochytrium replicatum]|nr:hypothetical protein BJ742DRAFT_841515 [Cladochytrium replicatum]